MRQPILILILAGLTYLYFSGRPSPTAPPAATTTAPAAAHANAAVPVPIIAAAPSSYNRWKTGPTAQNDWKIGPNAQTEFEPFAPSEQATWNQNPGYTIVAGRGISR